MTIKDFLLANYSDRLEDIANHGISGGTVSELIWFTDIDEFYQEHKEEIDSIVEEVFYEFYEGHPEQWFANAKKLGYDIINIDDARRFYVAVAVEVTAQNLTNQDWIMALSDKTLHNLADALTSEVVDEIFKSEEWAIFMQETIPEVITDKLGQIDDELLVELSFMIFDRINIIPAKWSLRALFIGSLLLWIEKQKKLLPI